MQTRWIGLVAALIGKKKTVANLTLSWWSQHHLKRTLLEELQGSCSWELCQPRTCLEPRNLRGAGRGTGGPGGVGCAGGKTWSDAGETGFTERQVSPGYIVLEAPGENPFPCLFQLPPAAHSSWLVAPSSICKASHSTALRLSGYHRAANHWESLLPFKKAPLVHPGLPLSPRHGPQS